MHLYKNIAYAWHYIFLHWPSKSLSIIFCSIFMLYRVDLLCFAVLVMSMRNMTCCVGLRSVNWRQTESKYIQFCILLVSKCLNNKINMNYIFYGLWLRHLKAQLLIQCSVFPDIFPPVSTTVMTCLVVVPISSTRVFSVESPSQSSMKLDPISSGTTWRSWSWDVSGTRRNGGNPMRPTTCCHWTCSLLTTYNSPMTTGTSTLPMGLLPNT